MNQTTTVVRSCAILVAAVVIGVHGNARLIGLYVEQAAADMLDIGAHGVVIGFIIELGRAHVQAGVQDFLTVALNAKLNVPRVISGVDAAPERVAVAKKSERFGGLVVNIELDVAMGAGSDEAVAGGFFCEALIVVDQWAMYGR